MSNIIIDDGSGLSRKNRMSPHAMVDILLLMYRSGYKDTFMRSLAVPADPYGTLKKRLRGVKLKGTVHGKTGYINRVKALSGYAVRDDGNVLVFSFIVNNYNPKSGWHINKLQNTLMETLVNASY
jgi:D-alanyl-D-alanine carboxypeptidase/D-alanyl-D-alanine-endopeptidase (penicillin-binding protein 4)